MNDRPLVCIVIPTWNRREDLLKCLSSITTLNYSNKHVIVIDNASSDGSIPAVRKGYPQVEIIELSENLGAVGASNVGFERSLTYEPDYILRLDSDAVLDSEFLDELVSASKVFPEAGLLVGKIYYLDDPKRIWSMGTLQSGWFYTTTEPGKGMIDGPSYVEPFEVDFAWSTGFLLTNEALKVTNGFDSDFFVYYEEPDLCLRIHQSGMQIWCVPSAKMWHRIGESQPGPWIAYQWARGKMLFFRKHNRGLRKMTLIAYAYLYALLRSIHAKPGKGNRGPLKDALRGLTAGLFYPLGLM